MNINNLKRTFDQNLVEDKKESKIAKKEGSFAKLPLDLIKEILSFWTTHQIPNKENYKFNILCKSITCSDTTRYLYEKMIGGKEKYNNKDEIAFIRNLWEENPVTIDQIKFFHELMKKDSTLFKGKLENEGKKDAFDTTLQFLMNELNLDFEPSLTGLKNVDFLIKKREVAIVHIWEYIFNIKENRKLTTLFTLPKLSAALVDLWSFFPNSFNRILSRFGNNQDAFKTITWFLMLFLKKLLEKKDQSENTIEKELIDEKIEISFFAYQILLEKKENNTEDLNRHITLKFLSIDKELTPPLSLSLFFVQTVESLHLNDELMKLLVNNFYQEVTHQLAAEDDSSSWDNEKTEKKCEELFEMCSDTLKQDRSFIKQLYCHPNNPEFLLKHLSEKDKKYIEDLDKHAISRVQKPDDLETSRFTEISDRKDKAIRKIQESEACYDYLPTELKEDNDIILAITSSAHKNGCLFKYSEFYRKDEEFQKKIFLEYIKNLAIEFLKKGFYFPDTLSLDVELVKKALKINPAIFRVLSPAALIREDITCEAIKVDPKNIWRIHESLKDNQNVMSQVFLKKNSEILKVIGHFPGALQLAPSWIWEDREIAYVLVRKKSSNYQLISEKLKIEEHFLFAPGVLEFASSSLLDDKDLMSKIMRRDPSNYKFISERLQKDEDILKLMPKKN